VDVAVAVRVAVAVAVVVGVAVAVAVAVGDAVRVAVAVAVTVGVKVAVAVAVDVAVAVGVGGNDPLAEPVSLTLADALPAVASLLIVMLAEKLPDWSGANSTVTVEEPCGWITPAPCPDNVLKNGLPPGGPTVTDSAIPPVSSMVKDIVPVTVWLDRWTLLKASRVGVTTSLLTSAPFLASPPLTWARTLAPSKIVAATMNDAIVQSMDTNLNRRRTIVSSPSLSRRGPGGPARTSSAAAILAVRWRPTNLTMKRFTNSPALRAMK